MPPHSQGAERRTERHASRWSLRVLVVGGLAGAAWLLTGAAAHAADRDATPSLIGSVVDGDLAQPAVTVITPVTRVLHAVARPQESHRTVHQHHRAASVLDVPVRILSGTVSTLTAPPTSNDVDVTPGAADHVVRDHTGTIRPTGGPVKSPVHALLSPPVKGDERPVADRSPATSTADPEPALPVAAAPAAGHAAEGSTVSWRQLGAVDRHSVAAEAAEPGTVRDSTNTPGGNGPAPLQVQIGAVSGIPASGSGAPTEGGCAAFLPAGVAAGTMAFHRLPNATDVEVRRFDVEAPTVSPD
jgi:hypothetical protein